MKGNIYWKLPSVSSRRCLAKLTAVAAMVCYGARLVCCSFPSYCFTAIKLRYCRACYPLSRQFKEQVSRKDAKAQRKSLFFAPLRALRETSFSSNDHITRIPRDISTQTDLCITARAGAWEPAEQNVGQAKSEILSNMA